MVSLGKLDSEKYMKAYIGVLILVALVSATGATLITDMVALNGTFSSTGIGTIFSATILGLLFAVFVFYGIYRHFKQ